jgi:high-affinity iron transporter
LVATFVIFLREGIEASMIVAILLSYLDRIGQRRHFRDVFVGVGAAVLLATGGGVAAYYTIGSYDGSRAQIIFETITYAVAAVVLTYMTFWMRSHARTIAAELRARAETALGKGERVGLGLLAFQAVGREGLETAVFTLAIVFATKDTHGALIGAGLGLVAALCVAFAIYRLGKRINLRVFFTVIGAVLMVFAAGLVADIVENLQQLGWLPVLDRQLWDTSRFLSENSSIGDIFHSLFGYADHPTLLQVLCYFTYLGVAITAFLFAGRSSHNGRRQITVPSPAPSPPGS